METPHLWLSVLGSLSPLCVVSGWGSLRSSPPAAEEVSLRTAEQGPDPLPCVVWPVGPQGAPLGLGVASLSTGPQVLFLTLKNLSWVIFVYLFLSSDVFLCTQFKVCVLSFLFAESHLSSWTAFFTWCGGWNVSETRAFEYLVTRNGHDLGGIRRRGLGVV